MEAYLKTLGRAEAHNSFGKYRLVASVYKGKNYVGSGFNTYPGRRDGSTIHSLYCGLGVHAELDALTRIETRRSILVIAGLSRTGFEITTEPCPRCSQLLRNSNLIEIIYMSESGLVSIAPKDLIVRPIPEFTKYKRRK